MEATATITYTYDPEMRNLTVYVNGIARGGFIGPLGETKFNDLLLSGADISLTKMNQEQYRKHLIRCFHAALAKQGIIQHKESILSRYDVDSTTKLSIEQLKSLVEEFSDNRKFDTSRLRGLRSELLTILNRMGIYADNSDWAQVNNFCMKHAGKLLYQMSEDELVKARRQFRSILDWYEQKRRETDNLQKLN